MKNIKFVAICTASGFILSLICGFFSHSGFGHIFLIALLFAVIFGALSFGISFVFDRFLSVETVAVESGSSDSTEASDGITTGAKPVLGQHVDLVIQEEELEHSGNQNHYDVGENHQMLNESDYAHNGEAEGQEETVVVPKNEFVPVRNKETVTNFSGSEAVTPVESENRMEAIAEQNEKTGGDLDVLPDMSELNVGGSGSSDGGETIVLSDADSDEREFVSSATNYKSSDVKETEIGDASLMAKAISSILSEET